MTYKDAEEGRRKKREHYANNIEKMRERDREYRSGHRDELAERARLYRTEQREEIEAINMGVEYNRKRKYTRVPIKDRFLARVDVLGNSECWNWKASLDKYGYGKFGVVSAHRMSYMLFVGTIPDSMFICHACDNPSCVNPNHLFVGTNLDNIRDCIEKGRRSVQYGEKGHNARLTWSDIDNIWNYYNKGMTKKDISHLYNVSESTIGNILLGKTWTKR